MRLALRLDPEMSGVVDYSEIRDEEYFDRVKVRQSKAWAQKKCNVGRELFYSLSQPYLEDDVQDALTHFAQALTIDAECLAAKIYRMVIFKHLNQAEKFQAEKTKFLHNHHRLKEVGEAKKFLSEELIGHLIDLELYDRNRDKLRVQ